jgi:hypothetical protein
VIDVLAMLPAFVLGWLVVRLVAKLPWTIEVPLGIGTGAAISSAIFFLLTWAGIANRALILSIEIVGIVIMGVLVFRAKRVVEPAAEIQRPSWIWALRIAGIVALLFAAMDFSQSITANPDGGYDAAAIWNLRARYLAGGTPSWHYAVSDKTGTNHPGYPLLLSAFVARTWILIGDPRSSTPAALAAIFGAATMALIFAGVSMLCGEILGWIALLVLAATEGFVSQASVQYADVPLSFFILGCIALLAVAAAREWPAGIVTLAGIFAGAAVWTKNEGIPFLAFAGVVTAFRGRLRSATWFAAGAAPLLILTVAFKFALVDGKEAMFPSTFGQAVKMILDGSRWSEIAATFGHNLWEFGFPWAHPFLLLAVVAWAFGFGKDWRSKIWLLVAPLGLLAADIGIYLITMSGLTWHLNTSNNRVIAQVWPALLFGFFLLLRPPLGPKKNPKRVKK